MSSQPPAASWLPPLPFGESQAKHNADIKEFQARISTVLTGLKHYDALKNPRDFRQKSTALLVPDLKLVASANTPLTVEVTDSTDTTLMIPFHGHNISINGSCRHGWRAGEGGMFYPGMGRGGVCETRFTLMLDLKPARLLGTARAMLGRAPDARLDLGIDQERVVPLSAGRTLAGFGRSGAVISFSFRTAGWPTRVPVPLQGACRQPPTVESLNPS